MRIRLSDDDDDDDDDDGYIIPVLYVVGFYERNSKWSIIILVAQSIGFE